MAFRVGREPRQPQKHRGHVVHTEETPGYDDTITQGLVHAAIVGEAVASVALDGETYAVEGGQITSLPRTSTPSSDARPDERKEPTVPKRTALPGGQQGDDVIHAITTYCEEGQTFDAAKVWATLGQRKQAEWIKAYGGRDAAFRKVKVALNNINYSGRIGIERLGDQKFRYTGPEGTPSAAYVRNSQGSAKRSDKRREKAKSPKVPVDKPASKPEPQPEPTTDALLARFVQVGTDMKGEPLFRDKRDGAIGHILFSVLK